MTLQPAPCQSSISSCAWRRTSSGRAAGPALKFVHQGAFEDLEEVYNRIDDFLVAKSLSMKKVYEEYVTDPTVTAPEKMITNIYVVTE